MNMKKTTAIILSAVLAFSLTGCGNSSPPPSYTGGNKTNTSNTGNTGNKGGTGGTTTKTENVTNKTISITLAGDTLSGTYSGEWKNGAANGEGEFIYNGDYKLAVTGTFKNGEPVDAAFLETDSDGAQSFYKGKIVAGNLNDTNAYYEGKINGIYTQYTGGFSNNAPSGKGDMVYIAEDGTYVRYIGELTNVGLTNGDYQIYNANGKLIESGKVINGEAKTDAELAAENLIDNIGRAVEQHFGFNGVYDTLKALIG